ncbi:MAG: dual specificity protein phosphatase family protein [Leptolyngbyaceae cyanobacterium SL_7_1]|nr:dual specificity protein phosphatase family protein [Leptolyngbyaceae cyanobacterium SL_7_1]
MAGIERSPTVCIAYLCHHHQLELWEALNCVRQVRPHALPTDGQLQVIRQFLSQSQKQRDRV